MRWLFRLLVSLVVLAILAVGAVFLLPGERIAALAAAEVRAATGRELAMHGRLRPSLWPAIGVASGPVELSNADWASEAPMLRAEGLSIGLDLAALVKGRIAVRELQIIAPEIVLERAADGRANWEFGPGPAAAGSGGAPAAAGPDAAPQVTLDLARISDGRVRFTDHGSGLTQELTGLDATLRLPEVSGPAEVRATARLNGQTLTLDAGVDRFAAFAGGAVTALRADIVLGDARLSFDGHAGTTPPAAEGRIDAASGDMAALSRALGLPAPDLPPALAGGAGLSGTFTYAPEGTLHLRDGEIAVAGNRLRGEADLVLADKPRLTGRFDAGALDLSAFTGTDGAAGGGGGTGAGGGAAPAPGWPTDTIDVSALAALDADLALSADGIDLGTARLGTTRLRATLTDRRLVFDIAELRAYEGLVTGNFVVNGRGGLSVGGDLVANAIAMNGLLTDVAEYDRLTAGADVALKFLGAGASVDAIMNSLSGSGSVSLGQGTLTGIDLERVFRRRDTAQTGGDARTIFESVAASFAIDKGVLTTDDLSFTAPRLTATGAGTVGLGAQVLDMRIVPVALADAEGAGGLKVPLRISGSWASPKLALDTQAIVEEQLDQQIEKQRQALEEDLRQRAAEELGLTQEEGESLEDAARRRLREEAAKGLRNLLNR